MVQIKSNYKIQSKASYYRLIDVNVNARDDKRGTRKN